MNRRHFLGTLGASALPVRAQSRLPNLIVIMTDDLGYGDLGCYGQQRVRTPEIDQMAKEGLRFTSAYAGSTVCAPSRCTLATGLHTGHAQMRGNAQTWLRPDDLTVHELLRTAGYQTAVIGKWSLGPLGTTGYPLDKGVDEFYGYLSQGHAHTYYPQVLLHNRRHIELRSNWSHKPDQYAPDLFTAHALKYIREARGPYYLEVNFTTPHANNEKGNNGMEVPSDEPYSRQPWPQNERNFAAMVTRMDKDVGSILEAVRRTGRDTFVLFTSDNGPHREGGHDPDFFDSNGIYRGIKRDLYEGGIRVPAIAWMPNRVPAGVTSDHPWAFWDLLPTFASFAGLAAPKGLDGQSILPTLTGKSQNPQEFLYWEFHERGFKQAVRHGEWKALRLAPNAPLELYNLRIDPGENANVAARHPDVIKRIEAYLKTARTDHPGYPIRPPSA